MIIYETAEQLLETAKTSLNVTFSEINDGSRNISHKGGVGQMIEESIFKYKVNSNSEPDIPNLGIEIKVTPYYYTRKGARRSKERLVLGMIDYEKEVGVDFYKSAFWKKNKKLLILFYENKKLLPKGDWFIDNFILFDYPEDDLEIIKNDYKIINNKIKQGLAHELSEGDTMYLGACTKGATALSTRPQPNSTIAAKKRAYSLKQSYMTYIINNYVYNKDVNSYSKLDYNTQDSLDVFVNSKISQYINTECSELYNKFNINVAAKQKNSMIVKAIIGVDKNKKIEEFEKANIEIKAIRVDKNYRPKEDISFPIFNFIDLSNQSNFMESDFYELITEKKFLFVVFSEQIDSSKLVGSFFWNMPSTDIDEIENVWNKTRDVVIDGVEFTEKKGRVSNNLPSSKQNRVAHVRPHSNKSAYKYKTTNGFFEKGDISKDGDELPNGDIMTKQCFWLNKGYIQEVIRHNMKNN